MRRLPRALAVALQVPLEPGETGDRIPGVRADPTFVNVVDRKRVQVIPTLAPTSFGDDKIGLFQHAQVKHDRASIEFVELIAERAGRERLIAQRVKDRSSDSVAESLEDAVVLLGI